MSRITPGMLGDHCFSDIDKTIVHLALSLVGVPVPKTVEVNLYCGRRMRPTLYVGCFSISVETNGLEPLTCTL